MNYCLEEKSLAERLKPRIAIEERFPEIGHAFRRKSLLLRAFEKKIVRPALKLSLQLSGLYQIGVRNSLKPVVNQLSLAFPNLPAALDGFRILQISDLHIDGVDGLAEILVPLVSGLRPDLCVLTGDYRFEIEGPCEEVYRRMRPLIASIQARHGIYGILGNHDVAEMAFALEDMGVVMLQNDAREIRDRNSSFWLIGVDDPFDYRCDDLPASLAAVPEDAFKVLLAHAPDIYETAAHAGIDLCLSGHTHAGQIRLPVIGAVRHNSGAPDAYTAGLWNHKGMQGYTSAGIGCSMLPVRYNCPPEVAMIELHREG